MKPGCLASSQLSTCLSNPLECLFPDAWSGAAVTLLPLSATLGEPRWADLGVETMVASLSLLCGLMEDWHGFAE